MYINLHAHSDHSNYRLLDSINKVEDLIKYTKKLGHAGVCFTEHETVGSHVIALHTIAKLRESNPDLYKDHKVILGNEIYLCNRKAIQEEKKYVFPHFILIAKNKNGHKCLRELSTKAYCENSFTYVNLRVPTFYDDLIETMKKYKGDIIASTACIGGALPRNILKAYEADALSPDYSKCIAWIERMQEIFGKENFFLEMQPSNQEEQIIVNQALLELSKKTGANYIITTDAHYLKKEDRPIHEAFLQSQEADREVADFYNTTYVMSEEEIHSYMDSYLGVENVQKGIDNTMIIYNMVEEYSLDKPLDIPYVPSNSEEPNEELYNKYKGEIPLLEYFYASNYDSDRHLTREIINCINDRPEEFENRESYEAINTCLASIKVSSEKQHTPWSAYLLQTKELIDICWESGSLVGPSRGSGCGFILLYMLGITQINPLREEVKTYHWRFLNPERVSPLDIDVDVQGSLRDQIIENLQNKYGGYHHVTKVQTISTSAPKKSIQIACRGLGYTNEEGIYLSSFIKAERGITFTLHQTFYGDEENNLKPNYEFVDLMTSKYADVWEVAQKIEGLCVATGQHAGGVILCKHDLTDDVALMKTKSGDVTTQFDLHDSESCSLIKWDLLGVDCLEKIHIELDLLLEDGLIEDQGSLRDTYNKYIGVYNIDRHNPEIWKMINEHKILSLFQFEKSSGWHSIELGQPQSLGEMAALNSVMRLMAEEGGSVSPLDRYAMFRKDISLWYKEMDEYGLTKEEQTWLEQYALSNYGLLPNQENFMLIVQDEKVGGYDLLWADKLRKSIAKKNPKAFLELQEEFYDGIEQKHLSDKLCHYVWDVLISMNRGYGFNLAHTLGYSIVALQEANLAYHYPIIYWNCANLISDSGGLDSTVNYGKNATAISRIRKEGTNVVPPYINEARFDFRPYASNDTILFGLKAIRGVGTAEALTIVANQPYSSFDDFYSKMKEAKASVEGAKFGDSTMIQLIKAGAFDKLENKFSRKELMEKFIRQISKPLTSLKVGNLPDIDALGLIPDEFKIQYRFYKFKDFIFKNKENIVRQDGKSPTTFWYRLSGKKECEFFEVYFSDAMSAKVNEDLIYQDGSIIVKRGPFEKILEKLTTDLKEKVLNNPDLLNAVNEKRFHAIWDEKCAGSISKWEMDSLCYYYHEHELANVDKAFYNIYNFDELPSDPPTSSVKEWGNKVYKKYILRSICGTVVDKDAMHSTISLLTEYGVVAVKFYKGEFGHYSKAIADKDEQGKKIIKDASWFERGTMLYIIGYRMGENFIPKVYDGSTFLFPVSDTVSIIEGLTPNGKMVLRGDRNDG